MSAVVSCVGGSIRQLLKKFHVFVEQVIRRYTYQILRGLYYLHSQGIMHRGNSSVFFFFVFLLFILFVFVPVLSICAWG